MQRKTDYNAHHHKDGILLLSLKEERWKIAQINLIDFFVCVKLDINNQGYLGRGYYFNGKIASIVFLVGKSVGAF